MLKFTVELFKSGHLGPVIYITENSITGCDVDVYILLWMIKQDLITGYYQLDWV